MAWEGMFDDLEGQWDALQRAELDAEVADRTRRERARVDLVGRLAAHRGEPVLLRLVTGASLEATVDDVGDGWLAVTAGPRSVLVVLGSVVAVDGLGGRWDEATRARRFGLGHALRALSRDRAVVTITDRAGSAVTGTIDHVGADHLDLAVHHADEVRRPANIRARRTVAYAALVTVSVG